MPKPSLRCDIKTSLDVCAQTYPNSHIFHRGVARVRVPILLKNGSCISLADLCLGAKSLKLQLVSHSPLPSQQLSESLELWQEVTGGEERWRERREAAERQKTEGRWEDKEILTNMERSRVRKERWWKQGWVEKAIRRGDTILWVWEVGKFQGWITAALQADSVWGGRVCLDKTAWQLHCWCPALGWLISKAEFDAGGRDPARGTGMRCLV